MSQIVPSLDITFLNMLLIVFVQAFAQTVCLWVECACAYLLTLV